MPRRRPLAHSAPKTPSPARSPLPSILAGCGLGLLMPAAQAQEAASAQLEPVVVSAPRDAERPAGFAAREATLGPLGSRPLLDTPYSISVVTRDMVENQQASSLTDLMKYLPSTQMEARGGMDVGRPQSRGMRGDVVANNHLDGLNVVGTTAWPMEMMERVEVINGLTGALYGPASPAGNFNFVQKRPTREPLRRLTLGYRSREAVSLHGDLGGRLGADGQFGYRLNLLTEDGESFVRGSDLDRKLAALALDLQIARDTRLEFNASHYRFDKFGLPGSFAYNTSQRLPDAPDASRPGYGQPYTGMELETNTLSLRLLHAFSNDWKLSAALGRQLADRYLATATNTLQGDAGDYSTRTSSGVAGRFIVDSYQASLNGSVSAAGLRHDLLVSATGYDWAIHSAVDSQAYPLGNASFDAPQIYPDPGFLKDGPRYYAGHTRVQALSIGDTIQIHPQWSLMLLGSQARLKSDSFNASGARTADYAKSGFSSTASLTYKPRTDISTYIAYADTLQEGATAPDTAGNPNAVLSPYRSRQYEWGAKFASEGLNAGLAIFQIDRPFAYTGSDNVFRVQGRQRNRGIELSLGGEVDARWSLYGGVTALNAKLGQTANAATSGKRMVGVPRLQASLLAEYRVAERPGLVLTGNLRHTGRRAINTENTADVKAYSLLDLGLRYSHRLLDRPTTWRLAINNVTDERYWAAIFPGNIDGGVAAGSAFIGEPREARLSVSVDF